MDGKEDKMAQLQLVKAPIISVDGTQPSLNTIPSTPSSIASTTTTSGVEASLSVGSESPSNITNGTNVTESMSTNVASTTTSIMEYGAAFSVIRSDREDDEEETKMSMVMSHESKMLQLQASLSAANKNKLKRKSKVKLNKIRKKNKHKLGKKKTKKKNEALATPKPAEDAEDRLSTSSDTQSHRSQFSKTPSGDEDLEELDEEEEEEEEGEEEEDEEEEEEEVVEDDSLSTLSESASTDSIKANSTTTNQSKNVSHRKKSGKAKPAKLAKPNGERKGSNLRNQPGQSPQYQVYNKKTYRRKRSSSMNQDKKSNKQKEGEPTEDEPRQHWLWNVACDFWPNCRNSEQCPFRHPTDKGAVIRRKRTAKSADGLGKPIMCRFGRECSRIDCWFWHPEDQETFIDPTSMSSSPKSANMQIKLNSTSPTHSLTVNTMVTPKQSATATASIVFSRDRTVSSHSVSSSNTGTDSIAANTAPSVHTDHSFETTEDAQSNKDNVSTHGSDFSPLRSTTSELERAVSTTSASSTVIISKTPKTNPWNKNNLKPKPNARFKPKHKGKAIPKLSMKGNKSRKMKPVPPLTAPITVGAMYPPRNALDREYAMNAQYNIRNMLPSGNKQKCGKQTNGMNSKRRKNAKEAAASTYLTADGKKITSKLNPNASEFEFASHFSSSSAPIRPPIRTSYFSPMMGMHAQQQLHSHLNNKHKYVGDLSPPFDPHSQLQNGGVFSPHNNVFSPTSSNSNHSNNEMKGFHGNMHIPLRNASSKHPHIDNHNNTIHNKPTDIYDSLRSTSTSTTTTTKTTTTTTISTVTQQTVNNNNVNVLHHHVSIPPLGTHIASPRHPDATTTTTNDDNDAAAARSSNPWQSDAYHPSNYPYDEYKQAPNASSSSGGYYGNNNSSHHNALSTTYSYNDTGDESKVIDEGHTASHEHVIGENYHRDRDDVDSVHSPRSHAHDHSQHTESHDGDTNPVAASHPWICPSCSFLNEIGTTACDLCSSARPIINEPEASPLDFDFNVQEVVDDVLAESNDDDDNEGAHDGDEEEEHHSEKNLSFNALFYGHTHAESSSLPFHSNSKLSHFSVGDHVLCHHSNNQDAANSASSTTTAVSIQGSIVDIDPKSPYPIRIEYSVTNELDKSVQKFMWVAPAELVKTDAVSTYPQYNDELLYDYDDEEDDD